MTQNWARPKLDARFHKDPRSRGYAARTLVPQANPDKARFWTVPPTLPLNQLSEGACVGFGWSGELAVDPVTIPVHNAFALNLFHLAVQIDMEQGRSFGGGGATTLAGALAAKRMGMISEFRWNFGIDDTRDSLVGKGPVVIGINWYDGMYETEANGLVRVNGPLVGGHCILLTGYWPYRSGINGRRPRNNSPFGKTVYQWVNSWGFNYGLGGRGYIAENDLNRLLQEDGESCIATDIAPKPPANKLVTALRTVRREMRLK